MMKRFNTIFEKHLKNAVMTMTPNRAEAIWEQSVEQARGDEWYLDGTARTTRSKGRGLQIAMTMAACLVICLLSYVAMDLRTDATIYLDVNPSVKLEINYHEKVIQAEASNEDGTVILDDMDLKGTDLDVAVNAILGSMVKHGYLSEARSMVLVSVNGSSREKTDALREALSEEINSCLTALLGYGLVFDQDIEFDQELESLAETYGMTIGKAALLKRLTEQFPQLDYGELAGLSMSELVLLLQQEGIDLGDYVNMAGSIHYIVPETGSAGSEGVRGQKPGMTGQMDDNDRDGDDDADDGDDDADDETDDVDDTDDDKTDAEDVSSDDDLDEAGADNDDDDADDDGDDDVDEDDPGPSAVNSAGHQNDADVDDAANNDMDDVDDADGDADDDADDEDS